MIPKVIHCVWLSGGQKPPVIMSCVASWMSIMPDYEIKEWTLSDVEHIDSSFLKGAIRAKKWAFATDFLRVYILYHYGGIYMDMDVMVYRPFDCFLNHKVFSGIEFWPKLFYSTVNKKKKQGIGIDAAIIGAEKNHKWIKEILDFYEDKTFINDEKYYMSIIMPNVIADLSIKYGFKFVPTFQILQEEVFLYPPDTFSATYAINDCFNSKEEYNKKIGILNKTRYSLHLCANSWGYVRKESWLSKIVFQIKHFLIKVLGKSTTDRLKKFFTKQ